MPQMVYRGTTTPPKRLKEGRGGFVGHIPYSVEQVRDLLKLFTGAISLTQCAFYESHFRKHIFNYPYDPNVVAKQTMRPDGLHQYIINANPRGPNNSFDIDPGCGGYASGRYVYSLDLDDLGMKEVAWSQDVLGYPPPRGIKKMWPILLLNADTLDAAGLFALKSPPAKNLTEVTMFIKVPFDCLNLHKDAKDNFIGEPAEDHLDLGADAASSSPKKKSGGLAQRIGMFNTGSPKPVSKPKLSPRYSRTTRSSAQNASEKTALPPSATVSAPKTPPKPAPKKFVAPPARVAGPPPVHRSEPVETTPTLSIAERIKRGGWN